MKQKLKNIFLHLKPNPDKSVQFLVFASFLAWFCLSRLYLRYFPSYFFTINGAHVHHYSYGIILLSTLSFIFLSYPPNYKWRLRFAIILGIALSLAYDEFAMWLLQNDHYYNRLNYDAVLIVTLLILNTIYFQSFWLRWGGRLFKLGNILLLGLPRLLHYPIKSFIVGIVRRSKFRAHQRQSF